MSVVAVKKYKDKIVISADTIMLHGDKRSQVKKLFHVDGYNFFIGCVGSAMSINYVEDFIGRQLDSIKANPSLETVQSLLTRFHQYCSEHTCVNNDANAKFANSFLIVWNDHIYQASYVEYVNYYDVTEIHDQAAIGYGDIALGAMMAGADPEKAVELTTNVCIYTAMPTTTYEICFKRDEEVDPKLMEKLIDIDEKQVAKDPVLPKKRGRKPKLK